MMPAVHRWLIALIIALESETKKPPDIKHGAFCVSERLKKLVVQKVFFFFLQSYSDIF